MNTHHVPKEELNTLYGVPLTMRVPASLKKKIADEAALRGMSQAEYSASLLISAYQEGSSESLEVNRLLQEKSVMQQQLQHLQEEKAWQSNCDEKVLQKLKKNREVLQRFLHESGSATKEQLTQAGFDSRYFTGQAMHEGKTIFCVFSVGYLAVGNQVSIFQLS